MRDIAIYGAGGFGRETAFLIEQINNHIATWNIVGFFDDGIPYGNRVDGRQILGGNKEANRFSGAMVIAIADPKLRKNVYKKLHTAQINYPVIIHPSCHIGDGKFNTFGQGSILTAGTILTTNITLGDFTIVNLATTIGHDVILGDYTTVMPGCSISGNLKIGNETVVGAGTRLIQNIQIGSRCVIGAGAVVTRSFPAHARIVGVPAKSRHEFL